MNNMYPYYNYNYGGNMMYNTGQVNQYSPYYYQYPNVSVGGIVGGTGISPINTVGTITTTSDSGIGGYNSVTNTPQTQISNMSPEEYQLYLQQYQQMIVDPNYYTKLYSSYGLTGVGK